MDDQIHDIDPATGLSRGIFAVDPSGHLITLGRTQTIKSGFRYATSDDIASKVDSAAGPSSPVIESAPVDPEPSPPSDEDIEPSPSDQD